MRRNFHIAALMALMTLAHSPADVRAEQTFPRVPESLRRCGTATVTDALDGDRLRAADGTVVRLSLIKAPELWARGAAYKSWPHARESRDSLKALTVGKTLTLACEGRRTNRLGERIASAGLPDGRWLQELLVAAGDAVVFPMPSRYAGLETLYKAEDDARAAKRGLWATDNLNPVAALPKLVKSGWFQIIRGKVRAVSRVGDTVYLNFGPDWRTDVTVDIPVSALRRFRAAGLDPMLMKGRMVEARGWVDYKNGPRLIVPGPGRLRILD